MAAYFLRRILLLIPTLLGITFLVFSITRFVPGGPIDQMMMSMQAAEGEVASAGATEQSTIEIPEAAMEALNEHYHLDRSFVVAYGYWLKDLLMLDLGTSSKFSKPVLDLIVERFPVSIYFGLVGFTLAYLVCIPLGVLKAVKHGGTFDFVSSVLVFIGYSIPGWALGAVLLVLLGGGSFFDVFPLGEFRSEGWEDFTWYNKILDQLHHTFLPVVAYAVGSFATLTVLMKNSLMENLGQDYVRTAFAKGLSERRVIAVHALRNSLIPIATGLGHAISLVLAGSYLVEYVFNIDGVGYLAYIAVVDRDYAVVMGFLVLATSLRLLGNILADVLYVLIDPRIRFN